MKILTAKEQLINSVDQSRYGSDVEEAMIEFAKLHVQEALRLAAEEAYYGSDCQVNKQNIIKIYPLTNIK